MNFNVVYIYTAEVQKLLFSCDSMTPRIAQILKNTLQDAELGIKTSNMGKKFDEVIFQAKMS